MYKLSLSEQLYTCNCVVIIELGDCMIPIFDVINNILIVYNVILICL